MRIFRVQNPSVGEKHIVDQPDDTLNVLSYEGVASRIATFLTMLGIFEADIINIQEVEVPDKDGTISIDYIIYCRN